MEKLWFLKAGPYAYAGKAGLSKCCWNPKANLGVTTHFSEIIELKFGKKMPYIVLYLKAFFRIMVAQLSLKNGSLTCFFLVSNNRCPHSHSLCQNTSVLGGTVRKTD